MAPWFFFSQWVMHRDPRYFDCPNKFVPNQWVNGSARTLPKYAYIPFGAGPRNCIGAGFAMMEIVLLLTAMAQRFQVTVAPGHVVIPQASFTLRPKNGIPVVLSSRRTA
ncbi:MAG: cytochrome P450 [Acidobacteriia bacterium]|nr:cytochrome P450 [Terriglobia bacterium]